MKDEQTQDKYIIEVKCADSVSKQKAVNQLRRYDSVFEKAEGLFLLIIYPTEGDDKDVIEFEKIENKIDEANELSSTTVVENEIRND